MKSHLKKELALIGLVPVVAINKVESAVGLARALVNAGLNVIEITFRTDAAFEAIKEIRKEFPKMIIAAGTVLTKEQVDLAIEAGVDFIVSPGFNPNIVNYCLEKGIDICPGCSNPSEVEKALEVGLDTVKFFPAENIGGLSMIKSMSAPYRNLSFMPTGGISPKNLNDYLAFDKIVCCGGSFMCPTDLIDEMRFEEIEMITKNAIKTMLNLSVKHIGINSENEADARKNAEMLAKLFMVSDIVKTSHSFFVGDLELMDHDGYGEHGHIAIATPNLERAIYYLEKSGFSFDMSTAKYDGKKMKFIYINEEISGFRFHLIKA